MKIKEIIAEEFAYDYAEPYGIFEPEDFIAKIKEWATDDLNFMDSFLLATEGLQEEWPELHDQVCAILKPYALRFLLKIAKNENVPQGWDVGEYFNHWMELIHTELKPDWPELAKISAVANRAFDYHKTESLSEAPSMADEDAIFNSLHNAQRGNAKLAVQHIFYRVEDPTFAVQLPVEADEKRAINKYKDVYVKGLLQWIRGDFSDGENDWQVISNVIQYLQHNGINWPEFKVMQQALAHNENK